MPEHFLNCAQVGATLQQVSRRRVPQPVGRNVMHTGACRHLVHHRTDDAWIDASTLISEEESVPAPLSGQLGTASHEPMVEGVGCGRPVGNHPFLVSFTDDTHGQGLTIQRRHIESAHFGDTQPAGVRQLEYRPVANLGRTTRGRLIPSGIEEHPRIGFVERRGKPLVGARRGQQSGRVTGQDPREEPRP